MIFLHGFLSDYLNNHKIYQMKKVNFITAFILLFIASTLSSCETIAGIFKAGMGVGIFIVIAIVAVIAFIVMKVGKNKK